MWSEEYYQSAIRMAEERTKGAITSFTEMKHHPSVPSLSGLLSDWEGNTELVSNKCAIRWYGESSKGDISLSFCRFQGATMLLVPTHGRHGAQLWTKAICLSRHNDHA